MALGSIILLSLFALSVAFVGGCFWGARPIDRQDEHFSDWN